MENTNSTSLRKPGTLVDSFNECICRLWDRCTTLEQQKADLQNDILQLEMEKARLTYECEAIRRCADGLVKAEQNACHLAALLTRKLRVALSALSETEVCCDGRSITAHIQDALKSLDGFYEMPGEAQDVYGTGNYHDNAEESKDDEFYF